MLTGPIKIYTVRDMNQSTPNRNIEKVPCLLCNKPTAGKWFVNYDNTSGEIIAPEATPEHGQYGALPVGGDCRLKLILQGLPREWIFKA